MSGLQFSCFESGWSRMLSDGGRTCRCCVVEMFTLSVPFADQFSNEVPPGPCPSEAFLAPLRPFPCTRLLIFSHLCAPFRGCGVLRRFNGSLSPPA